MTTSSDVRVPKPEASSSDFQQFARLLNDSIDALVLVFLVHIHFHVRLNTKFDMLFLRIQVAL